MIILYLLIRLYELVINQFFHLIFYNRSTMIRQSLIKYTTQKKGVLDKINKIEQQLQKYEFIQKINDLASNYVFFFNLNKVVNSNISTHIRKLCILFFKFLFFRIVSQQQSERHQKEIKQQRVLSQTYKKSVKVIDNLQNKSNYETHNRINKNRANTTLEGFNKKKEKNHMKTANFINYSQKENQKSKKIQGQNSQDIKQKLIKLNKELKQAYFQLIQSNKTRVVKIQIICFLIAMISPDVLQYLINLFQKQLPKYNQEVKRIRNQQYYSVQQQVYIVLIYQTLGSLISPNAFQYLKKKYIKNIIIKTFPSQQYSELLKSLKFIKQNLKSQKNVKVILGRRKKDTERSKFKGLSIKKVDPQNDYTKQRMKQFMKQALKIKQDLNTDLKSLPKQQCLPKRQKQSNTFYPLFNNYKSYQKLSIPKENLLLKHSPSIKLTLNLKSQQQNGMVKKIQRKLGLNKMKNTFYKFKSKHEQKQSYVHQIKSQRPSYKFNRISNETNQIQISKIKKIGFKKNSIQFMKNQISKFKYEAKKDLQAIEQFKPCMSFKQSKFYCISDDFRDRKPFQRIQNIQSTKLPSPFLNNQAQKPNYKKKQINMRASINQKEQIWHPMYNIRSQAIPTSTKSVQQTISYKLSKKSDKLRKIQHNFEQDCKRRIDMLEDDIDYIDRMRMK